MAKKIVIAEVVKAGTCRYYWVGQKFMLDGFTPAGLCDSAYVVLARDVRVMRYGGKLPWEKDGTVMTHCPDPQGAIWQLRLADNNECQPLQQNGKAQSDGPTDKNTGPYEMKACRGFRGECPYSLHPSPSLVAQIEHAIQNTAWFRTASQNGSRLPRHHDRFTVALAACPNGCTQPQIKDMGIIADARPNAISSKCDGCSRCTEICLEKAITVCEDRAKLISQRCVGCALCIKECPQNALHTDGVHFRILVGGRMGKHPQWGQELCLVSDSSVPLAVKGFLDKIGDLAKVGERIAAITEKLEITELKKEIVANANVQRMEKHFSSIKQNGTIT